MRITDLNGQNMSDFKMKVEAADSSSSARPHHHDSNNYNTYHHHYYQNRDLFNNNTNNNNNDDDQVNIENNDARSSSKPGGNCFQVPHQKDGHLQSCSTKHSPSFNRDESLNRAYYDTQQRLFRHSQQNRTTSSRGVMHPPEQVSSSPATDVSVIPWIRNLPSSCSELDSRPQSCIKTEAEASSTSSFNSNSMDIVADFERRKSAKAEPIRPIPHMVPSEFLRRGIIYPPDNSRPPSTPFSVRSTVIDFGSRNSSSFSSPRHSAVRRGQKRGLSISPLSTECIDLNAIIRTSPNSLVAFITGSRGSSAASRASRASGSYGHLSAASISPSPFCTPVPGYFGRQRNPFSTPSLPRTPSATLSHRVDSHEQQATSSSSSFNADAKKLEHKNVLDVKKEEGRTSCAVTHQDAPDRALETASKTETFSDEDNDELTTDFRCYWSNCGNVYDDQTGLVAHVNNDHIQKSKKDCTCYWKDCAREEKPFKAMYMLVVHVRRHTGEKPHACDFPGCSKAYSRLENLKTHRRSHTGERPYACEFEGCNKAFSNASDRAKHQNRTHSSIKQYGCKVEGCPKRYTDPSSLRKHMKTVHGATAQPNKKMKGEKPESRKEVVERKEKEQLEQRRKSVGECLTVKPLQQRSPGSNDDRGSSGSFCNRGQQYTPSPSLPFSSQGPPQQSDNTFGTYRAWGVQQASPASTTTSADCESAEMSPLSQQEALSPGVGAGPRSGAGGGGPTMQMQAHPRQFLPRLGGKPRASEGLLHEVSRRLSDPRRMSNTSMISMDSGAESVISSYNGSRRGSDISLQSYLSSRRSSLNSPMPPSRLSPRNIANQTVIEGKVFESASPGTTGLLDQGGQSDHIDVGHLQHNRQSRVSSGYGSQTAYFHCKSPAVQQSPTPPVKGQRRASDGNVTRLGDKIFEPANIQTPMHNKHRRGSEPISPVQIFNGELPRRNSLSSFNPLPIPESMRMSLGFHPSNDDELGRSPRMNHYIKPNLFVQHQNMVADVEPQFPPSEEELAQGSLFSSTSQQSCDSLMQAADSTVPEPGCLRIGGPIMNNNVDTWSSMQRPAPAQQRATVVAEADSTADWMTSRSNMRNTGENYEDLIVREIRGLNTGMDSRPQTNPYVGGSNMAINDMNTLLSSLNEENKYYESNRMGHGGIGHFL